jgi:hypothetical protein
MLGLGLGVQRGGVFGNLIDSQASAFYDRVIADGGVVPTGLIGVSATFKALKKIYGVTDISTAISIFYDAHYLGYKLGTGTGVTLNQAITKLYSAINSSGDAIQATLTSQPLLLAHSGNNYYYGSGVLGNYCSTPDAVANRILGDTEIIAKFEFNTTTTTRTIVSKWGNGSNLGFLLFIGTDSKVYFGQSLTGLVDSYAASSIVLPTAINTIVYLKVTRVRSTGVVTFFTSSDGITYTQLGTTITSMIGDRFNSTANINIAAYANGSATPFTSALKVYQVTIASSIGGTPTVNFNPQSYSASTSQTQWTSTTGEVWTINTGTATTGYKGVLVYKTLFQADGANDSLVSSTFSNTANITDHFVLRQTGWVTGDWLYDGTTGAGSTSGLQQTGTSPNARFEGVNGGVGVSYPLNTINAVAILGTNASGSVTHYKNNVLAISGGTKGDPNGISLMMRSDSVSSGFGFGNGSILTFIRQIGQPSSTVRTDVYNFIRTLNNNF